MLSATRTAVSSRAVLGGRSSARVPVCRSINPGHGNSRRHPEDIDCPETFDWNTHNLPSLQQRIVLLREAQALHFLQHRYTPTKLHEHVEEGLASRPDLPLDGPSGMAPSAVHDWHEEQWAKLKSIYDVNGSACHGDDLPENAS